jgi:acetyl esterase/lipase
MRLRWLTLVGLLLVATTASAEPAPLAAYLDQPRQRPDAIVHYGKTPSQIVEIFQPKGAGPHPVVVLLHGGCYLKELEGLAQTSGIARDLADRGFAVWNVEYRRLGEAGAGYPGTFEDAADAVDALREHAAARHLDLSRVVAVGHSAGGQLALWVASRNKLPTTSPLHRPNPLPIGAVVSLAGIGDLERHGDVFSHACGADTFGKLLGAKPSFADTSPARLLPTGVHVVMVHGTVDHVMPPFTGREYVAEVNKAGDRADLVVIPDAGHFDLVIPTTPAWRIVADAVEREIRSLPARR